MVAGGVLDANAQKPGGWKAPFIKARGDAPNILWICTDQQRWDTIGALGNKYVKTPNIDRLVREGVSFTNAHCQSPVSAPSRASFLTGMYPSAVRVTRNGNAVWPEAAPLVTKLLKDAGYECGLAGKFHLSTAMARRPEIRPADDGYTTYHYSHSPYQGGSKNDYLKYWLDRGIDINALKKQNGYVPAKYHQTTWCVDRAIDFIKERREWPWQFSLNVYDPHNPLDPPQEYIDRYNIDELPAPRFKESDLKEKSAFNNVVFQSRPKKYPGAENRRRTARYLAQIDMIDENIGRLMKALEESGQLENTLIIFMSDHGDMLGDHGLINKGCRFYNGLVRVPLVFWHPKKLMQNLRSDALVELIDVVPTLLELAGLPVSGKIQGKSLLPILTGEASADFHKEHVRCEYYDKSSNEGGKIAGGTMFRTKKYKLALYHGHAKGELFDMENDPDEFTNLWDDPAHQQVLMKLIRQSYDASIEAFDKGPEKIARY
ncbi:hypothetical protein CKA38_02965 [Ereboglobus luteus]|uniref:Sulfatase N-terminal domain-containing protein n=2 Tax=Ereboglobus luteus TaxID=1796921 RepID=A0A2U8E6L5_9BACT|nr:hypothetical protein CKA38_02965 [Ereboglobus luteus]